MHYLCLNSELLLVYRSIRYGQRRHLYDMVYTDPLLVIKGTKKVRKRVSMMKTCTAKKWLVSVRHVHVRVLVTASCLCLSLLHASEKMNSDAHASQCE